MPGSEEKIADSWMDNDSPRIGNAIRFESLPVGSVQLRDFDVFGMPVEPVEFTTDPVDGQPFQSHRIVFDDRLLCVGPVNKCPVDGLGVDIGKVESIFPEIEVDSHHVAQILMDDGVLFGVNRHVTHVILVSENKPRLARITSLASVLVRLSFVVSLVTFTIIRARSVHAVLRTNARCLCTLVNVRAGFAVVH